MSNPDAELITRTWEIPERKDFEGKYCRLEPLATKHYDAVYDFMNVPDANNRYQFVYGMPSPGNRTEFDAWFNRISNTQDPVPFVVIDKATGKVGGKEDLMAINKTHGSIEIGSIIYGPEIAKTRCATEALYLMACYVFEELGYRRFEWKCNNQNTTSKNAAVRFGFQFEGVFRQNMVHNGRNRDTAYYSIIDKEWPALKVAYEKWLDESNFDEKGNQKQSLASFRC